MVLRISRARDDERANDARWRAREGHESTHALRWANGRSVREVGLGRSVREVGLGRSTDRRRRRRRATTTPSSRSLFDASRAPCRLPCVRRARSNANDECECEAAKWRMRRTHRRGRMRDARARKGERCDRGTDLAMTNGARAEKC